MAADGGPLATRREKDLLRFLTCGSVDDGKSTLMGRLLYDCSLVPEDQLATLERDSRRFGTNGGDVDFSLLLDGLEDERQQRITIDVAYRFFATRERAFAVADTPGHEHYTRNMATGASSCELAVILVDARKGVLPQTKRHAFISSLLGIRHIVLAVNKMDLVGFDQHCFEEIATHFSAFAAGLGNPAVRAIPLSAKSGDNIAKRSARMPWYHGPSLLEHLHSVEVTRASADWKLMRGSLLWARANSTKASVKSMPVTVATLANSGKVNVKLPVPQPTSITRSSSERPPNPISRGARRRLHRPMTFS
jgi:bifunctional enzyme CysN/CysC